MMIPGDTVKRVFFSETLLTGELSHHSPAVGRFYLTPWVSDLSSYAARCGVFFYVGHRSATPKMDVLVHLG